MVINMSTGFNLFRSYEIIRDRFDYWYDDYRIFYEGGDSTSHSSGNIIKVQNLIEKYSGKRIPQVNEYVIDSDTDFSGDEILVILNNDESKE